MRHLRVGALTLVAALIVGACAPAAAPSSSQAPSAAPTTATSAGPTAAGTASGTAAATAATKPYAGVTLSLWEFQIPSTSDLHKKYLADFEAATGIKVELTALTEGTFVDKLKIAQLAKDPSPDVFYTDFAFKGDVVDRGASEFLEPYLTDAAKTPSTYDVGDISPGLMGLCQIDGKQICIPFFSNGTFYYYNKKIFADAGITGPPTKIEDILAIAKKTNDPAKGISGICMRGSAEAANQYAAFLMSQYFLPYDGNKAVILDKNYKPLLDTPEAKAWMTEYEDLMKNYTPKGIQSYGYLECNRDFEQGKVAQYWEADPWVGEFLDPTKSKVVSDVGFSVLPCPPNNPDHCIANAGGGWFLNGRGKNKDAAWELLKWLTSLDNQVKWGVEAKTTFQVTRNKALPMVSDQVGFPKEVSDALTYAHAHAHPSPFPPIPNIMDMVLAASRMCTTIVAGQATVDAALAQAQKEITDSMIKNGLYKP